MDHVHFLADLLSVFAVAAVVVLVTQRARIPSVVGLLAAGVLVGPHALSLVHDIKTVETLAEIGVVVLLFAVGLEFSLPRLVGMGRLMARIGLPQVLFCGAVALACTWGYFGDWRQAVFAGMLLAMSSTAVAFKLLSDRGDLAAPHGNVSAAVLLFQDLLVVACMVALPLLAAKGGGAGAPSLWYAMLMGTLVVAGMLLAGRYVVPHVLFWVVKTKNRELFLMTLVLMCLGSAALTGMMGWSLALGAFIAGLAMSESEYATQTLAEVLPFRDTLASLFFISIGMLLDLKFLTANVGLVLGLVAAAVAVKFVAAVLPTVLAGYPLRVAVLVGVTLAQIGEFSFILADRGRALGLLNPTQYQTFLATAVLTVALTPLLINAGPRLAGLFERVGFLRRWKAGRGIAELAGRKVKDKDHVVVIGYGLNGRNLARVLGAADVNFVVLELNPETVRLARTRGEPVHYGDCTRPAVLEHVGVDTAKVLVVAISDPSSSRRAVQLARHLNPKLHIIARTRYLSEVAELRRLGANSIIPEEFETSVEIFARVLGEYEVPKNLVQDLIGRVRGDHYEVLRDVTSPAMRVILPHAGVLEKLEIQPCWVRKGSPADGKSVGELRLRSTTGATLVAVRRGGRLMVNPGPDHRFEGDDTAYLVGDHPQVESAMCLLDPAYGGALG